MFFQAVYTLKSVRNNCCRIDVSQAQGVSVAMGKETLLRRQVKGDNKVIVESAIWFLFIAVTVRDVQFLL